MTRSTLLSRIIGWFHPTPRAVGPARTSEERRDDDDREQWSRDQEEIKSQLERIEAMVDVRGNRDRQRQHE